MRTTLTALTLIFSTGILNAGGATAAELNCSSIRLISPFAAGGANDTASRLIAERLEQAIKRPVVVENRGGAAGNIGTAAAASAVPDGCTLLNNASMIASFKASFSKLPFDPINDLTPVGSIGVSPTLLVTAASNPPNDLKGLIAWSKTKPGGLNFGIAGYGMFQHLAVEEIGALSGAKFTYVAYKGGAQAVTDPLANRIDFGSFAAGSLLPLVKDGKLKALAVAAAKRSELVPDVPTAREQGVTSLDAGAHFMIYAPAKTPKAVIDRLSTEIKAIVGDPALKQRFLDIGIEPEPATSEEMVAVMRRTGEEWTPLIKRLNIRLD